MMYLKWTLRTISVLALLLVPVCARSQTAYYTEQAIQPVNVLGVPTPVQGPIPYAAVRVCSLPLTQTSPCLPLATITDQFGNALSNSIGSNFGQGFADVTGRITIGCTSGTSYQLQYSGASNTPQGNHPISCGGNSPLVGNNFTVPGNLTVSGTLNSNSLNSGNVANKSVSADGIRYVSNSGNDSNDGLSEGTAKLTVGGACASLAGGNSSCTAGSGTIYLAPSFSGTLLQPATPGISIVARSNATAGGGWNWFSSGSFPNTQMVELIESDVNGCNAKTEFQLTQGNTNFSTDAVSGCVATPTGAVEHNVNAIAGYANTSSTTQTAGGGTVGGYFQCRDLVGTGSHCWGINPVVTDAPSITGAGLTGGEFDVNVQNTSTTGVGIVAAGAFSAQPTNNNMPAFVVSKPAQNGGGGLWTSGFNCNLGAISTQLGPPAPCLNINPQASGNSQTSQGIFFASTNSGGTSLSGNMMLDASGNFALRPASAQFLMSPAGVLLIKNGSNAGLAISTTIQDPTQSFTMGLTLKKGSGAGNYTNATTSYAVADSTNLCFTVTIPTGWKLGISVSGALSTATAAVVAQAALTDNAACSTANAGILVETAPIQGAAIGVADAFSLDWVITGDGNAHNIALQFKTSNAADTASLINSSATITPTMKFELMPSN